MFTRLTLYLVRYVHEFLYVCLKIILVQCVHEFLNYLFTENIMLVPYVHEFLKLFITENTVELFTVLQSPK